MKIYYDFYIPKNYGSVRRSSSTGKVTWNKPDKNYQENWDIKNLSSVWEKIGDDALQDMKIIPDDCVKYIIGGGCNYYEIDDFKNRKLVIRIVYAP